MKTKTDLINNSLSLCDIADAHPKFRTAYMSQLRVSFETTGDSRTKQNFKNECDVNNILKNYNKTGVMPENFNPGEYRDLDGTDYQEYMQTVASANSMFEELPSALRKRFKNDPAQLLSFVHDDKNVDEAHKLGLLRDDFDPSPIVVESPIQEPSETV
jgi:phage internal scaffolding protein